MKTQFTLCACPFHPNTYCKDWDGKGDYREIARQKAQCPNSEQQKCEFSTSLVGDSWRWVYDLESIPELAEVANDKKH
jgi:hypothetical protein